MELKHFTYRFDAGPFSDESGIASDWNEGNCRRMLQWYFYENHGVFLAPQQVLCPSAYNETGDFVFTKDQKMDLKRLRSGDIVYAERIRSKDGNLIDKSETTFETFDEYVVSLHTAIYIGDAGKNILHATSVEGGSCHWTLDMFLQFYRFVAVKRIL